MINGNNVLYWQWLKPLILRCRFHHLSKLKFFARGGIHPKPSKVGVNKVLCCHTGIIAYQRSLD